MTPLAWLLGILATAAAVADWNAVARDHKRAVQVFKPLTLLALLGLALAVAPRSEGQRDLFVAALLLGLTGDVFLMFSDRWFMPGLAAFLVGHLLYSAGFMAAGLQRPGISRAEIPLVLVAAAVLGQIVGRLVRRRPGVALAILCYGLALAGMAVLALASGSAIAAAGGILFLASDAILAWNRFIRPLGWAPLVVIVTYHLAQGALALSLAR